MKFRLITLSGVKAEAPLVSVTLVTADGRLTVLPHHEPLMALVEPGMLEFRSPTGTYTYHVSDGFLVVTPGEVQVIVREVL